MCNNPEIAANETEKALDNVMMKIEMQAEGNPITTPRQDLWLPVPRDTVDCGYMKIMGLGIDENNWNYSLVKIHPNSESVLHYHNNMIERFILIKGKMGFKVFKDNERQHLLREGFLTEVGQCETVRPGEWHLVLSSLVETYVIIVYKEI